MQQHMRRCIEFVEQHYSPFRYDENDYVLIHPKVVFHTWVAVYGVGVFDGSLTLEDGKTFNYVKKVLKNAKRLNLQRIPLMLVYSQLNLPLAEEKKMQKSLNVSKNVHLLCLETDLKEAIPEKTYQGFYNADLSLLDHLRLAVIYHADAVLEVLRQKYGLPLATGNAILYNDIDIVWSDGGTVPSVYAYKGMCSCPRKGFMFAPPLHAKAISEVVNELSDDEMDMIHRHHQRFYNGRGSRVAEYILSGEAFAQMHLVADLLKLNYVPTISSGENSILYISLNHLEDFKNAVQPSRNIVDFHRRDTLNWRENTLSIFLQLIPYFTETEDGTWTHTPLEAEEPLIQQKKTRQFFHV